nr:uncharacterized protein LOC117681836 isoform X1 [Crassostrea gigas]
MPDFRNNERVSAGSNTNPLDTFPNANRFSNVRKGLFRPAIARVPGAFDLAVAGISVKTVAPTTNSHCIESSLDHIAKLETSCKGDNRIEQGERNRVPQTSVYTVARSSL